MYIGTKKKFLAARLISVCCDLAFNFFQGKIFSLVYPKKDVDILLWIYGISVYLVFFDLGFSKLAYSRIRALFLKKEEVKDDLVVYLILLSGCSVIICFCFIGFVQVLKSSVDIPFSRLVLLFFSLNISFNIFISYIKSLYSALDLFLKFEVFEILRKLGFIASLFLLLIDKSMLLSVISLNVLIVILTFYLASNLIFKNQITLTLLKPAFKTIRYNMRLLFRETKNIFLFSAFEAVIYNVGLILVPVFLFSEVGNYSIWLKLFFGIAVFMRIITDVNLPELTSKYFNSDRSILKSSNKVLVLSIGFIVGSIVLLVFLSSYILAYWTNGMYTLPFASLVALAILLIANSLQHLSGTVLLSVGYFQFLKNVSFIMAMIIFAAFAFCLAILRDLPYTLLVFSVIYLAGSLVYYKRYKLILYKQIHAGEIN